MSNKSSRPLQFAPAKKTANEKYSEYRYKVVIADDDADVHTVTKMVLKEFHLEGAGLEFIDTYSGEETMKVLRDQDDIAVLLLDVVMEEDVSGLKVVEFVRKILNNNMTRIILKTGQPGVAPEEKVIVEYDINDYRSKSELTAQKFITTMYTALRNYRDLKKLEMQKKGLEMVIESSANFYNYENLSSFFNGLLNQLNGIRNFRSNSFMASTDFPQENGFIAYNHKEDFRIIAGTGKYEPLIHKPLSSVMDNLPIETIFEEMKNKKFFYHKYEKYFIGYYKGFHGSENLIYLEGSLNELNESLIKIFLTNYTFAFDRLFMNRNMMKAMENIILMLGETIEYRDGETGFHVQRVSKIIRLMAEKSGKSPAYCDDLGIASIVHDIGKIAISDSILLKPGKLTEEEFETIKGHTTIGYNILKGSEISTIKMAALIALNHHEKWNGMGYPGGLKGEEIPWEARLTAIVDVYDALINKRYYKDAWEKAEVYEYLEKERGLSFDPDLIDLFMSLKETIEGIQEEFSDDKKKV